MCSHYFFDAGLTFTGFIEKAKMAHWIRSTIRVSEWCFWLATSRVCIKYKVQHQSNGNRLTLYYIHDDTASSAICPVSQLTDESFRRSKRTRLQSGDKSIGESDVSLNEQKRQNEWKVSRPPSSDPKWFKGRLTFHEITMAALQRMPIPFICLCCGQLWSNHIWRKVFY